MTPLTSTKRWSKRWLKRWIEDTDEDSSLNISDFAPSELGNYWIYDVDSNSNGTPEMNYTATDSLYVLTSNLDAFTLGANDDNVASATMNNLLISGSLSKSGTALKYTGTLELPIDLDIDLDQTLAITDLIFIDLDATNGDIMYDFSSNYSDSVDIQGTVIPLEISYSLTTKKENFYPTHSINGTSYTNVYEASLNLTIAISGTVNFLGVPRSLNIIKPGDILTIRYFYGENIGLLRAENTQTFELSTEAIAILNLIGGGVDIPTSVTVNSIEELNHYFIN